MQGTAVGLCDDIADGMFGDNIFRWKRDSRYVVSIAFHLGFTSNALFPPLRFTKSNFRTQDYHRHVHFVV
jgi:hypothetical protein